MNFIKAILKIGRALFIVSTLYLLDAYASSEYKNASENLKKETLASFYDIKKLNFVILIEDIKKPIKIDANNRTTYINKYIHKIVYINDNKKFLNNIYNNFLKITPARANVCKKIQVKSRHTLIIRYNNNYILYLQLINKSYIDLGGTMLLHPKTRRLIFNY